MNTYVVIIIGGGPGRLCGGTHRWITLHPFAIDLISGQLPGAGLHEFRNAHGYVRTTSLDGPSNS